MEAHQIDALFPLIKRPLISARLHSRSAPSTAAGFRHATQYHRRRRCRGRGIRAENSGQLIKAEIQKRSVESEWRKEMGINEAAILVCQQCVKGVPGIMAASACHSSRLIVSLGWSRTKGSQVAGG
jgi:hypothetical protein